MNGAGSKLKIVVVGQTFSASRTPQRVSAMGDLGHAVTAVPITPEGTDYETSPSMMVRIRYRLRIPGDPARANAAIFATARNADVLWLEAADMIRAGTLRRLKRLNPDISIVGYSEDDMMNPRNRTIWQQQALHLIDLWATTKSLNTRAEERAVLKPRKMLFVNNSYDPAIHRPVETDAADRDTYGASVSFIGTYEAPRAQSVVHLARNGVTVRVWGNG